VPEHLRSKPVQKPKTGYKYAHDYEGHIVDQEYAPTSKIYYEPTDQGYEATIGKRLAYWRSLREEQRSEEDSAS
jgi:putative ATPase